MGQTKFAILIDHFTSQDFELITNASLEMVNIIFTTTELNNYYVNLIETAYSSNIEIVQVRAVDCALYLLKIALNLYGIDSKYYRLKYHRISKNIATWLINILENASENIITSFFIFHRSQGDIFISTNNIVANTYISIYNKVSNYLNYMKLNVFQRLMNL